MTEPIQSWAPPEGQAPGQPPLGQPMPAAPVPLATPKKGGAGRTNLLLVVAAMIAIGGLAFAGGRATAPVAASSSRFAGGNGFPGGSFNPGAGGRGAFAGRSATISGTVKAIDGTKLTIATADGTEATIDVSGATYHSQTAATAADVTPGATVKVSVNGFGGFRPGAGASAAPGASGPQGAFGGTIQATDVTVTPKQ